MATLSPAQQQMMQKMMEASQQAQQQADAGTYYPPQSPSMIAYIYNEDGSTYSPYGFGLIVAVLFAILASAPVFGVVSQTLDSFGVFAPWGDAGALHAGLPFKLVAVHALIIGFVVYILMKMNQH